MDISRIKEDTELTESNARGFEVGDHINISVKFDGANASFRYDEETGKLIAFSRKQELTYSNTLSGFWNFVESLNADRFKDYPNYVFFGEWALKNKIVYKPEYRKIWLMYDVYDVKNQCYLPQSEVKTLAEKFGFTYIHVLYDGEFISWEH
jgi:ATP-dependent RNA circularization protein (DNA/RNA ligase family)